MRNYIPNAIHFHNIPKTLYIEYLAKIISIMLTYFMPYILFLNFIFLFCM